MGQFVSHPLLIAAAAALSDLNRKVAPGHPVDIAAAQHWKKHEAHLLTQHVPLMFNRQGFCNLKWESIEPSCLLRRAPVEADGLRTCPFNMDFDCTRWNLSKFEAVSSQTLTSRCMGGDEVRFSAASFVQCMANRQIIMIGATQVPATCQHTVLHIPHQLNWCASNNTAGDSDARNHFGALACVPAR